MSYKWVKLSQVCEKITDGSHFSPSTSENGFPYITVKDISDLGIDYHGCKFISDNDFLELKKNGCAPKVNDLLFSKDGTVGKVAIVKDDRDFVVLSSLAILTPNTNLINPNFLFYVLKSPYFLSTAVGKKTGVAIKRIILKNLKEISIPLPSLSIQQKIVDKLDSIFFEIDKAVLATEANIKNSESLFLSYLKCAFTADKSWVATNLGDVFEMYQPKTITTKDLKENGEYPVYGANGVIGKYDRYNHEESQLLVTCRGATCGAVNVSMPFSWINGNAMVVKAKTNEILFEFVEFYFRGAADLSKAITGAAQPQITRQSLSPIPFSYPKLNEQLVIVNKLKTLFLAKNNLKKYYQEKFNNLISFKSSTLSKAFNGELVKD